VEVAQSEIRKLRRNIDRALNTRYSRRGYDGRKAQQYVATIALIKGVPFYGYNVGWKLYCKIYLYNPRYVSGLMDVLLNGGVTGRPMQPYEGHINYTMQFLIDYNLCGCGFVEADEDRIKYRRVFRKDDDEGDGGGEYEDDGRMFQRYDEDGNAHPQNSAEGAASSVDYSTLTEDRFAKHSYHGWEVDIRAADILNRYKIEERRIHQDFSAESTNALAPGFKHLHSLDELWKTHGEQTQTEDATWSVPPSTAREETKQKLWFEEQDYRDNIRQLIEYETRSRHARRATFDNILRKIPYGSYIATAFESVGYLSSFDTVPPKRSDKKTQAAEDGEEEAASERTKPGKSVFDIPVDETSGVGEEEEEDYGLDEIDFNDIPLDVFGDREGLQERPTIKHTVSQEGNTEGGLSTPSATNGTGGDGSPTASGELRTEVLTQLPKRKCADISGNSTPCSECPNMVADLVYHRFRQFSTMVVWSSLFSGAYAAVRLR